MRERKSEFGECDNRLAVLIRVGSLGYRERSSNSISWLSTVSSSVSAAGENVVRNRLISVLVASS